MWCLGIYFLACNHFCVFNLIYMRNAGWFWQGIVLSYIWHIGYGYVFSFRIFVWPLWFWWHIYMWHANFNKFCIITLLLSPRDTDVVPACSVTDWSFLTQSWCFFMVHVICAIFCWLWVRIVSSLARVEFSYDIFVSLEPMWATWNMHDHVFCMNFVCICRCG